MKEELRRLVLKEVKGWNEREEGLIVKSKDALITLGISASKKDDEYETVSLIRSFHLLDVFAKENDPFFKTIGKGRKGEEITLEELINSFFDSIPEEAERVNGGVCDDILSFYFVRGNDLWMVFIRGEAAERGKPIVEKEEVKPTFARALMEFVMRQLEDENEERGKNIPYLESSGDRFYLRDYPKIRKRRGREKSAPFATVNPP